LALAIDPRMKVIRDHREAEPMLLRESGEADQVIWPMLLAGELVADFHQGIPAPRRLPVTR
jgi:hypothetical protein